MKKISRRSFLTVVGAAAATAALTACRGSSSSTAASTSSAASTAAPAATASNASVVLKFDLTVSLEHPWALQLPSSRTASRRSPAAHDR